MLELAATAVRALASVAALFTCMANTATAQVPPLVKWAYRIHYARMITAVTNELCAWPTQPRGDSWRATRRLAAEAMVQDVFRTLRTEVEDGRGPSSAQLGLWLMKRTRRKTTEFLSREWQRNADQLGPPASRAA
ncbi:hypothetical protein Asi02nite_67170 [Asanoa siamensis]|uniref:Secreted protein n=1 Tax=Asanoa siamensis TaxID=926357 RepID=A0ABQ4D0Y3_9ACTN|nr:hypothetical protein Asi02nite_67170 [Asanoa siamensis]